MAITHSSSYILKAKDETGATIVVQNVLGQDAYSFTVKAGSKEAKVELTKKDLLALISWAEKAAAGKMVVNEAAKPKMQVGYVENRGKYWYAIVKDGGIEYEVLENDVWYDNADNGKKIYLKPSKKKDAILAAVQNFVSGLKESIAQNEEGTFVVKKGSQTECMFHKMGRDEYLIDMKNGTKDAFITLTKKELIALRDWIKKETTLSESIAKSEEGILTIKDGSRELFLDQLSPDTWMLTVKSNGSTAFVELNKRDFKQMQKWMLDELNKRGLNGKKINEASAHNEGTAKTRFYEKTKGKAWYSETTVEILRQVEANLFVVKFPNGDEKQMLKRDLIMEGESLEKKFLVQGLKFPEPGLVEALVIGSREDGKVQVAYIKEGDVQTRWVSRKAISEAVAKAPSLTKALRQELQFTEVETYDDRYASQERTAAYKWLEKNPNGGSLGSLTSQEKEGLAFALHNLQDILTDNRKGAMAKKAAELRDFLKGKNLKEGVMARDEESMRKELRSWIKDKFPGIEDRKKELRKIEYARGIELEKMWNAIQDD